MVSVVTMRPNDGAFLPEDKPSRTAIVPGLWAASVSLGVSKSDGGRRSGRGGPRIGLQSWGSCVGRGPSRRVGVRASDAGDPEEETV